MGTTVLNHFTYPLSLIVFIWCRTTRWSSTLCRRASPQWGPSGTPGTWGTWRTWRSWGPSGTRVTWGYEGHGGHWGLGEHEGLGGHGGYGGLGGQRFEDMSAIRKYLFLQIRIRIWIRICNTARKSIKS